MLHSSTIKVFIKHSLALWVTRKSDGISLKLCFHHHRHTWRLFLVPVAPPLLTGPVVWGWLWFGRCLNLWHNRPQTKTLLHTASGLSAFYQHKINPLVVPLFCIYLFFCNNLFCFFFYHNYMLQIINLILITDKGNLTAHVFAQGFYARAECSPLDLIRIRRCNSSPENQSGLTENEVLRNDLSFRIKNNRH